MPTDSTDVLIEFRDKFEELGGCDQDVVLVMAAPATAPASVQGVPTLTELDLQGMVVLNEEGAQDELAARGVSVFENETFTIWGGILDMDIDGETPLGRSSIIVAKLRAAMNHGGGIRYGDTLLPIIGFYRGLVINQHVTEWHVICRGKTFDIL